MNLDNLIVMDWETSGDLPEYSLQSWRIPQGKAWGTSLVWLRREAGQTIYGGGVLASDALPQADVHDRCRAMAKEMLIEALDKKMVLGGWNLVFDIAILIAYGLEDLANKCRFVDGMLTWRHFYIEPEYDLNRDKKKSYGLKTFVAENFPQLAGYEDEIDFHDSTPEARAKLHRYNQRDCLATYAGIKLLWERLTPEQRRAALIEAQCLPMVAGANFRGLPVDPLATRELQASLVVTAERCLSELAPFGVTEATVRSPTKLGKLLFDDWGLPVLKENVGAKTKIVSRATDKEVLHDLAFKDPRARTLHQYREALGNKTKFADNILDSAAYNEDGRTHPQGIVFSTYCVPGDVEVLTRQGWVRLDQWQGGDIVQVAPDLRMNFLPAERFVGPETDDWLHFKMQSMDCLFTPGHTIPYLSQKKYLWRTQLAGELGREVKNIPVAGHMNLCGHYTPDQMRLFAAVQADGCYKSKVYKTTVYAPALHFTFCKERKIIRMHQLLDACKIRYRERTCTPAGYPTRTEITVAMSFLPSWLGPDKKFFGAWVLDTSAEGLIAFVDEVVHWDGSPHQDSGVSYSSSVKGNVEWVVTAAALVGRKAAMHKTDQHGMTSAHISDIKERPVRALMPRHRSVAKETHQAYCATTQTGFWLARSKGNIFVTGNTSRMSYTSKQGRNKAARPIGFAIHQEKGKAEGKFYRAAIVPPEGYDLVEFDAAGQEFRWMAILSGDEAMLQLCLPGEDAHSFMGAQISSVDYRKLIDLVQSDDHNAKAVRTGGKFSNLCVAEGTVILTDRGVCCIEDVRLADKVWDGLEFVRHAGVICSGVKTVIAYSGLVATPEHEVLVDGGWVSLAEAAETSSEIARALGEGWARRCRSAVRIVDSLVRRLVHEKSSALCAGAVRLWPGARSQFTVYGDWAIEGLPEMRHQSDAPELREFGLRNACGSAFAKTHQRLVSEVRQSKRQVLPKLRSARDKVLLLIGFGSSSIHQRVAAASDLPQGGHRPPRQQWSLRAWKLALGFAAGKPQQHAQERVGRVAWSAGSYPRLGAESLFASVRWALCGCRDDGGGDHRPGLAGSGGETQGVANDPRTARVYDIVDCGPRMRFAANGLIVHNSFGYRISARRACVKARVDYGIPMELPHSEHCWAVYRKAYKGVPVYWDRQIRQTKRLGYVETLAGRRVEVEGNWSGPMGWSMESTAINYPVQGCLQRGVRVETDRGLLPIADLVGQIFRVWTGFRWAVATAVSRGAWQLAEITLATGETILCDTRHKLKTSDRTWVAFADMRACWSERES